MPSFKIIGVCGCGRKIWSYIKLNEKGGLLDGGFRFTDIKDPLSVVIGGEEDGNHNANDGGCVDEKDDRGVHAGGGLSQ